MPGLSSADVVNKVPDLGDVLMCAANPEEVPLITRMRAGKKLTQMTYTEYVEIKPGRKSEGATDGEDVSTYENGGPRREILGRAQEFRRTPKVGQQTQEIVESTSEKDQFARLKLNLGKELLKDVETRLLSDEPSQADQGTPGNGSKFAGLGDRLSTSAQADQPIPSDIRIPANQIITSAIGSVTETTLEDAMEARRNLCGHSAELTLFAGTKIQRKFNEFENYYPEKAGHEVTIRTMHNVDVKKTVSRGIRFYEGSFGTVEVVMDDFVPNQYRGYLLDMEYMKKRPHGKMAEFKPLPDLGGGPRGLLKATLAYSLGDPRAHLKLVASA